MEVTSVIWVWVINASTYFIDAKTMVIFTLVFLFLKARLAS